MHLYSVGVSFAFRVLVPIPDELGILKYTSSLFRNSYSEVHHSEALNTSLWQGQVSASHRLQQVMVTV